MVSGLRRLIILIRSPLFFVPSFGRAVSASNRGGWLSTAWGDCPLTGRGFPIRWRRPTIPCLLQSAAVLAICREFMHALVVIIGIEHPLESAGRSFLSLTTCGSFGGNKRRNWWRGPGSYTSGLRWRSGVVMVWMWVARTWGRCSVLRDRSYFRRRAVSPSVGRHRARSAMTSTRRMAYTSTGTIIRVRDTVRSRRLGCRRCQRLR